MGCKCGIVGLPNVGKSTLFNSLTDSMDAQSANYPFCTIEPNIGIVPVKDERLDALAEMDKAKKVIPAHLEFHDIAGIVKNAHQGEGLGNKFLDNIREVDLIAHVVRCFDNDDIIHVDGEVNPIKDIEIVNAELILSDMSALEKYILRMEKKAKSGDSDAKEAVNTAKKMLEILNKEKLLYGCGLSLKDLRLLTNKPMLYVCNVDENSVVSGNKYSDLVSDLSKNFILISANVEMDLVGMKEEEKLEFLSEMSLDDSGLSRLGKKAYDMLNLITFFTSGEQESRAWTIPSGACAPEAAGVIHSDFQRGFISAETIHYDEYKDSGGRNECKKLGIARLEGKKYIVQDGDVILFHFNV